MARAEISVEMKSKPDLETIPTSAPFGLKMRRIRPLGKVYRLMAGIAI
jgi:hypothetical protein